MSIKIYKDGKWQILPGQGSPGKSAYEYASENGFVGSEEDFANALGSIDDIADKIENIDTTPTEGSNNLVTSGGIHKALKDLSITGDVDLSNQLNEVEEDIDTLYNRTNDNEKNINAIIDILKGEEEWPDDWVPGDSACCETLREEVSELENRVGVIESTGESGTVDVEKLKDTFDNRYLVKVEDSDQNVNNDTVFHKNVDINGDLTVDNVKSSNFHSNGFAGSGFGITSDGTNHTLEIDNLIVRKEAHFNELVINQIRFTRGATVFSHAGATITAVEIHDDFYRCYYDNSELKSGFIVGDLGRCQRFGNVVEGFNDNVKNHYYWREIVGVGDDYFDLSKTNADGTGEPAEGDDVCQFGNINDENRQSAIVIDPQNGGSIEVYNKIDSFNLTDKNYIGMGTKDNESYIYGYGKMFFGSREDGGHYIKYENGRLVINGNITIGDTDISDAVIGDETLSDLLDSLGDRINQIDNKIDYFSGSEPVVDGTLSFSNEWITNGEADAHVGDRYTCTTDNSIWQFTKNADGSYIWIELDSLSQEEVESLIAKSIDGHKRIFVKQPEGPYDVGDLWVDKAFLKVCNTDRESGFDESEWDLVSDEATNKTIKELESQIKDIMDNANDDDVSFYFDEDSEKNLVSAEVGDIFYAIDTTKAYKWNGASWKEIEENHSIINVLKELSKTASALDGKISCYRSDTKPESARDGDLWFDTTNNTLYVYNNENWEETRDNSLDYLKELFPNYLQSGAVLTDILAIKNGDSVVAGMYGGSRTTDLPQLHDSNKGSLMIFSGVGDFDDNTTYSTKIWSDGTIESEKFALNNEKVIINDDTIIIGNDDSGKITLGFEGDSNEIPILKYVGKDASTSWDMRNALFSSQDGDRYSVDLGVGKITYNSANTTWEFDGNLLVTGGVSFYTPLNTDVQYTYWDQLPTGDYFEKVDGVLQLDVDKLSAVIGGSGGVDESVLENYYTKTEVDNLIAGGSDGEINLDGYVSRDAFPELFNTNFNTSIAGYLKSTDAESTYATKDSLNNYLTTESANNYALKNDLEAYLTKSDAQSTYTTISEFNTFKSDVSNTYATKSDLNTHVAAFDEHKGAFEKFKTDISKDFNSDNITANSSLVSNNGLTVNNKKLTCTNGVWQLDGDLLVTGGVSFYSALDNSYFDYTEGINTDNVYIINSGGKISLNYDRLVSDLGGEGLGSGSSIDSYTKAETDAAIKLAKEQILGIVEDSSLTGAYDTLKEVANWIVSDGSAASGVVNRVAALETKVNSFKNTTYTFSGGTNGFSVTPSDGITQTVSISHNTATTSNPGLMTAAMVTKLDGIAVGAEVNVQSDWNTTNSASDSYIKNKPSLAAVATSGSYNDLSNKPTIPTYSAGTGISISSETISIKTASNTLGGVKTTSNVTSASGMTACPIINGVPYYSWRPIKHNGKTWLDGSNAYSLNLKDGTGISISTNLGDLTIGLTSTYAGGTAVTLNGSSKSGSTASFYAPTTVGDSGYILKSNGSGAPAWIAQSSLSVGTSSTCTGNAATATKLKTSVELWGNSFDGSGNITGSISITATNPCISFLESDKSNDKYNIQTNNGYLYIGHSASDYYSLSTKFDSSGNVEMPANLTVKGGITFYSQKSLKNIHETDFLSLDQLSNIHAIKYTWKDGRDDRMHVGGIADDIQKIMPEVIYENDGYLTMDYGNAGFVIGTSLIKPVVDHEKRIKELEEEVARLNNLLNA